MAEDPRWSEYYEAVTQATMGNYGGWVDENGVSHEAPDMDWDQNPELYRMLPKSAMLDMRSEEEKQGK